jgi:putative transposase
MPKRLKRVYGSGDLHFITFSCYRRLPLLASAPARDIFVQVLRQVRSDYDLKPVGYVVMPEHVHLLISEPARSTPSTVLKMLKQRVSHRLRREPRSASSAQDSLPSAQPAGDVPQLWQRRFYDFNVWSRKKRVEKLAYMHMNPVKRGLVEDPKDWRWSSYSFYQGRGAVLVEIDYVE